MKKSNINDAYQIIKKCVNLLIIIGKFKLINHKTFFYQPPISGYNHLTTSYKNIYIGVNKIYCNVLTYIPNCFNHLWISDHHIFLPYISIYGRKYNFFIDQNDDIYLINMEKFHFFECRKNDFFKYTHESFPNWINNLLINDDKINDNTQLMTPFFYKFDKTYLLKICREIKMCLGIKNIVDVNIRIHSALSHAITRLLLSTNNLKI